MLDLEVSFPLFARRDNDSFYIIGTSFSIGGGVFMTAGHCIGARQPKDLAVQLPYKTPDSDAPALIELSDVEVVDSDIGLFTISEPVPPGVRTRSWRLSRVASGTEIMMTGYPITWSTDSTDEGYSRTFRSSITARHRSNRLDLKPWIYETSGYVPAGLSGSAAEWMPSNLNDKAYTAFPVIGVVIGNESEKVEVLRTTETEIRDGHPVQVVNYKEETAHYGIIVSGENFDSIYAPKILGHRSIKEHLASHGLVL